MPSTIDATPGMDADPDADPAASGSCLVTRDADGTVLDAWFPAPRLVGAADPRPTSDQRMPGLHTIADDPRRRALDEIRRVSRGFEDVHVAHLSEPPVDALDAWLRLHLLSHRLIKPHGADLTGIFGLLANVVWTDIGPCPVDDFESLRVRARLAGYQVRVFGIDRFPAMTEYVVPSGVRIADASRVRLGAHLAPGTTVMHEGFVNYNAGSLGPAMIEGRVSQGVVIGDGTDVGGGASIMGTLSGGGTHVISVGTGCLIGANAGIGISLGDDCVVAAGCYVTAGTKVRLADGSIVKALELSGRPGLLFWQNSQTGAIEAHRRDQGGPSLNADLHATV